MLDPSSYHAALIIALCLVFSTNGFAEVDSTEFSVHCNLSAYRSWSEEIYAGELLSEDGFWPFQNVPLTRRKAIELASQHCRRRLKQLRMNYAGRHGPVKDKYIYDAMCSDILRMEAMLISGCSCMDLSTQPEEVHFSKDGDFCLENTGRMLCDVFDQCGTWGCDLADFMCPRYEYNKFKVPHRGYGSCMNSDN